MKRLFLILLCLSLLLSACGAQTAPSQDVFYYPKAESDRLPGVFGTEPRLFPEDASLSELLDLYCAGPESAELENLLPPGTAIRSWDLRDGILRLDFNAGLSQLSGIELTVTAACIARTFLERFGAQTLVLTAEGSLLNGERGDGNVAGLLLHVQLSVTGGNVSFSQVTYTPTYIWRFKADDYYRYRVVASEQPAPEGMDASQAANAERAFANLKKSLGNSPITLRVK